MPQRIVQMYKYGTHQGVKPKNKPSNITYKYIESNAFTLKTKVKTIINIPTKCMLGSADIATFVTNISVPKIVQKIISFRVINFLALCVLKTVYRAFVNVG